MSFNFFQSTSSKNLLALKAGWIGSIAVLCVAGSADAKPVHTTLTLASADPPSVPAHTSIHSLPVEGVTTFANVVALNSAVPLVEQSMATSDRAAHKRLDVDRSFSLSNGNTSLAVNTADAEQALISTQANGNHCEPGMQCWRAPQTLAQLQRDYPTTPYPPTQATLPIPSLPATPISGSAPPPPSDPVGLSYAPAVSTVPPPSYPFSYPTYPSGFTAGYPGTLPGYPTGYPAGLMPPSYGYPTGVAPGYPAGMVPTNYPSSVPGTYPTGFYPGYPVGYPTSVAPGYPAGVVPPNYASGVPTAYPAGYPTGFPMAPPGYPTGFPISYPAGYPTSYPVGFPTTYPSGYPMGFMPSPNHFSGTPGTNPAGYPTSYPAPPGYPSGFPMGYPAGYPTSYPPGAPASAFPPPPGFPAPNVSIAPTRYPDAQVQATERKQTDFSPYAPRSRSTALNAPSLKVQGVYVYQGDDSSARARLTGTYPLTPQLLVGATLDVTTGRAFTDTPEQGFNLNELYLATSFQGLPNLRFVVGQLDLTSYFDRNSFAKDGASQFFNPVFQTNSALSATGIGSRPSLLANWRVTDNIEAKAAVFSSARNIGDFALDGFAGEVGLRFGNAIIRGTYVSDRDGGRRDGFQELFQLDRGGDRTGPLRGDREEAYGINAEVFIPQLKMGLFARYGRQNNVDLGQGGDTYSGGISFLDLLMSGDRLGLAYGRGLSNDNLRRQAGSAVPDVLELFYDFRVLPNLRLGFTIQERNGFSETIAGFRLRTEFDVTPSGKSMQ